MPLGKAAPSGLVPRTATLCPQRPGPNSRRGLVPQEAARAPLPLSSDQCASPSLFLSYGRD